MNNKFSIILSTGEIYVLAGMTGYSTVFAVDGSTLGKWQKNINNHVKSVFSRLEKRMLVYYEPSGVAYIDDNVLEVIHALCKPDSVVFLSGSAMTGRYSEIYCFKKNNKYVVLSKVTHGAYKITMTSNPDIEGLLSCISPQKTELYFKEIISYETAQRVKNYITSFDTDNAEQELRKYVGSEKAIEYMIKILSFTERYLSIRCVKNAESYYGSCMNGFVSVCGDVSVRIEKDENEMLCFESVGLEQLTAELKAAFDGKD